jgi:hypothetical protein
MNVKKLIFISILTFASLTCSKCIPMVHESFPISVTAEELSNISDSLGFFSVSPNGSYIYSSYNTKINTQGDDNIHINYMGCTGKGPLIIAPNERYISGNSDLSGFGIFDIQDNICLQPENPLSLNPVESWSPNSNRFILAQSKIIMDFPSFSVVPYPTDYSFDYTIVKNLYGNGRYLWDRKKNLPIAELVTDCAGCLSDNDPGYPNLLAKWKLKMTNLQIPTQSGTGSQYEEILLESEWPTYPIYPIFDSTGEYVLVALKERSMQNTSSSDYDYSDPQNIKDTVVYLIHWRTKEKMELLRLSQYGSPQNYISSLISWSEDRSTILIPRYQAAPLVVRLKWD